MKNNKALCISIALLALTLLAASYPPPNNFIQIDCRVTKDTGFAVVSWTLLPGNHQYWIYRGPLAAPFDSFDRIGITSSFNFYDPNLSDGNNYAYKVFATP